MNKDFIESQYMYQNDFSESIALIYGEENIYFFLKFLLKYYYFFYSDPFKTQQGSLHLKAYRLMPNMMELQKKKDFTAEALVFILKGFEG